jgi:hypothetical protein
MSQPFDTTQYLAMILPQAKQQRHGTADSKRSFYENVKQYIAGRGISARDYEYILRAVCDAMDF